MEKIEKGENQRPKWFAQLSQCLSDSNPLLQYAANEATVLQNFSSWIESFHEPIQIICCNASHQESLYRAACERNSLVPMHADWICLQKKARAFSNWSKKNCSVQSCLERINESLPDHRAMSFVKACAKLDQHFEFNRDTSILPTSPSMAATSIRQKRLLKNEDKENEENEGNEKKEENQVKENIQSQLQMCKECSYNLATFLLGLNVGQEMNLEEIESAMTLSNLHLDRRVKKAKTK
jgi:hypothetical protein